MTPTDYDGENRRKESWHLAKEVPLTLIVTVVIQTVGVVWYLAEMKKDIELLKADTAYLHQKNTQNSTDLQASMTLMRAQFDKVDAKLDRLIERERK